MTARPKHFIEERHAMILKLVKEHGRVTVKDLCERFTVTLATVRTDLDYLEGIGQIRRTHGGAMPAARDFDPIPFGTRRMYYGAEKRSIGKAAASLVKDGEVVFIDGGTTAPEMRRYLGGKSNVTIITPSIEVAQWLTTATTVSVYLLNGFLNRDSLSTVGVPGKETMLQMNISKAFCGAAGVTPRDGLTDVNMGFVDQKRIICQHARVIVGLVDRSKIGVTSLASFVGFDDIDILVTDKALPPDLMREAESRGIEVIVP
jgi:DeoR family transcriptional regulator, aga operon transcriptional repressor